MKRRHILIGVCIAVMMAIASTAVVFADWGSPYQYNKGYDINWQLPGGVNLTGFMWQWDEWSEYWDPNLQRYTYYNITDESLGYIEVDTGSYAGIAQENAVLTESDSSEYLNYTFYDSVAPGYYWYHDFPFSDVELAKPTSNDGTSICWNWTWNYVVFPGGRPVNSETFFFATREYYRD